MKAARYHGPLSVSVDDIPEPTVGPDDVKILINWCGICGSDLGEYVYGPLAIPSGKPHPLTHEVLPVVIGHEIAGEVADVGANVTGVEFGDRVVVEPLIRCQQCVHCRAGRYNLCELLAVHGLSGGGGGLANYTVVPAYTVHHIPSSMPFTTGALVEPLVVGVRAVDRAAVSAGDRVAVFGAGPVGLMVIAALRTDGIREIVVIEPAPVRRDLALKLGATVVHDVSEPEALAVSGDEDRFDVVFEASGVPSALDSAIALTRKGGTLLCSSRYKVPATVDPNRFRAEITMVSTQAYCGEFPRVIEGLANGLYDIGASVTKQIALADVVSEGFESLLEKPVRDAKILVDCRA